MLTPGAELEDIIHPVPLETFLEGFERSLYIPGDPTKFEGLFDLESFEECLRRWSLRPRSATVMTGFLDDSGSHCSIELTPGQLAPVLGVGRTVQVEGIDRLDERLADLRRAFRRRLSFVGPMNFAAFLSPRQSGYSLHLDSSVIWILQIHGHKRWKYAVDRAIDYPLQPMHYGPESSEPRADGPPKMPEDCEIREQVLNPGDVLYMPAGVWHTASAEGLSLHLGITAFPTSFIELVFDTVLRARLGMTPEWRNLPSLVGLTAEPELRERVEPYLEGRLQELRAAVDELTPELLYAEYLKLTQESGNGGQVPAREILDPASPPQR